MLVFDFIHEARKRNYHIKPPPKVMESYISKIHQGEMLIGDDKVRMTIEPVDDVVTIDVIDNATNTQYLQFIYDQYTLFLILEVTHRMLKELEKEYNEHQS